MASFEGRSLQCPHCGVTTAQLGLPGFSELTACAACGLTLREGSLKMQEDLANMFDQNMTLSTTHQSQQPPQPSTTAPITYSISQHYHHSAHVMADTVGRSSDDITPEPNAVPVQEILIQHNIDPSCLLSSQLDLFQQAAPDQRSRLIELWCISPPTYTDIGAQELNDHQLGSLKYTTLEQEEEMAQLRYARIAAQALKTKQDMRTEPRGHVDYGPEPQDEEIQAVEPYIKSGYEVLVERDYNRQACGGLDVKELGPGVTGVYQQSIDPVFQGREWWHHPDMQQPMEHQYGMFDQMNQFRPSTEVGGFQIFAPEDEEML